MIKARENLYFDEENQAIGSVGADALHRLEAEVYQRVRWVDEGIDPYEFIRVFNKTLKSVLLGRRIAASGHCR